MPLFASSFAPTYLFTPSIRDFALAKLTTHHDFTTRQHSGTAERQYIAAISTHHSAKMADNAPEKDYEDMCDRIRWEFY